MSKLDKVVRHFASTFLEYACSSSGASLCSRDLPAAREAGRIARAYYRFKLYRNIFRGIKIPVVPLDRQRQRSSKRLSPWENEQLASTRDYLFAVVSPGTYPL